jgi:hypothetical protein
MDVQSALSSHQPLLADFSGRSALEVTDSFWIELLTFPVALSRLPPAELEAATTSFCEQLGETCSLFSTDYTHTLYFAMVLHEYNTLVHYFVYITTDLQVRTM